MVEQVVARSDGSEHLADGAGGGVGIACALGGGAYYELAGFMHTAVLFSFPPSAAGESTQFFHGGNHDVVRHVGCDLDLSDLTRKHEMNHATLRFLVGLQARENLACA